MDRVLTLHAGSRRFDSHRGICPNDFSGPVDQDIHTQCTLSWKIVVSEWRSVIAVSLNFGGGVPYQTSKTVHVHANTLQTHRGQTHSAGCVQQWFHTAEPLGKHHYKNWNTHIHTH